MELSGFYRLSREERNREIAMNLPHLPELKVCALTDATGDAMIENYVGQYALPLGIATNFTIDGEAYVIPMAIEEPSVIAAASNGAKRVGNIHTTAQPRELIGQMVFEYSGDPDGLIANLNNQCDVLLKQAKILSPSMVARGGGPTRVWFEQKGEFIVGYLGFNPCDAMGANAINHVLEGLSPMIEAQHDMLALMRILSNYQPDSLVTAKCRVPIKSLDSQLEKAQVMATRIAAASRYAQLDPYRATTNNKGIMNGIDAVLMATGNDWRAVEAGVHAFASQDGSYQPLTTWTIEEHALVGKIKLPLAVATVGGTLSVHPTAQWSLELLGNPDAETLSRIIAAVGLAQNFAALRAIVSEGIQKGHMGLHARQLAIQVGATDQEREALIAQLKAAPSMSQRVAAELLEQIRSSHS
ncbi:hydroxymethylglutaryl-CoA reductase, degradative [Tuanshanicoccus lijuaniae]|uniref:hydroxymethylglutaryl-CoA reductase, degradative n=1 Tax=Aerococcaceae bacterium zg-1292 TaxID=2774330 RepID=UPI0019385313|nr:hydroxymethylglutaryl-CoA reductase, degradative [Aerococcaceae bacterium zg-1292]QQA36502.1 hydroxymethylglutaryl-CoA reductase, degradative [Aerococcaceae bacterium zg-1292]